MRVPGGRLRESQQRFESLFRAMPVPTYAWRRRGEDFILVAFNDAADVASRHRANESVGKSARELYQTQPDILEDIERCARDRSAFRREMLYTIAGTDETYMLDVAYVFVPPDQVVVHTVDLTDQRRTESELRQSLGDLQRLDEDRRRLMVDVVQVQERERERIAEDIHDDTIQTMTAVSLRLGLLREQVADEAADEVGALEHLVQEGIAGLRHLTFELHPPALEQEGLAPALRSMLEHMSRQAGADFRFVNKLGAEPPAETRVQAYRIAQEAIANARRHAGASVIDVVLDEDGDDLRVRIQDDGSGFDTEVADAEGHFGLRSMRRRAELVGGRCEITSVPGEGTVVTVRVPIR
jgi:signal transduction histidine kinase